MDKYNIINPTNNLADLNNDMANWCNLPYDMRIRSNDECIRLYNCTVIDLYNRIKESINRGIDARSIDRDNIVRESSLYKDYSNYPELLKKSKELQESPYIVILDPDIDTIEELDNKYESFAMLNDKNKRLSNDFSWQIWGYNVPNMYEKIKNEISTEDPDLSNIKFVDSISLKVESCVLPLKDQYNHAILNNNLLFARRLENNINESGVLPITISRCNKVIQEDSFDYTILPKVVPWFTSAECAKYSLKTDINPNTYFHDVNEAYINYSNDNSDDNESKLLELAWNPSVEPSMENFDFARRRQAIYIDESITIVDVSNVYLNEYETSNYPLKVKPIYFILGYPETFEQFANINHYNKAGISFDCSLSKIYTFNGVDNSFKGFNVESLNNYQYIDVVIMFVDIDSYNKIYENCNSNIDSSGFSSVYSILNKTRNPISPDNLKLIYSQYIDLLLRVANIDISSDIIYNNFVKNKSTNIFKIYNGFAKDYNQDSIDRVCNILRVIQDNTNKENYVMEFAGFMDDKIYKLLSTKPAIYSITD